MKEVANKYFVNLIYIPTGEVIHEDVTITYAAEQINIKPKSAMAKMGNSESKEIVYGNYMIKLKRYNERECAGRVYHASLDELCEEFLRVCRTPKLWATIDDDFCGQYRRAN